jgi:hypothetical protein
MMVSAFLSGRSTVGMGEVIGLIYNHDKSQPSESSKNFKAQYTFLPHHFDLDIKYVCSPELVNLATQLRRPGILRMSWAHRNDPEYPDHPAQIRPSSQ